MSHFCNACGQNSPVTFENMANAGYTLSCIRDQIYGMLEETVMGWSSAFLSSLLGHILLAFGFLLSEPTSYESLKTKLSHGWSVTAFIVLVFDCAVQIWFSTASYEILLRYEKPTDDTSMELFTYHLGTERNYTACDTTEVTQLSELRLNLSRYGDFIMYMRCICDFVVIYALYMRVKYRLDEDERKDEGDEDKMMESMADKVMEKRGGGAKLVNAPDSRFDAI